MLAEDNLGMKQTEKCQEIHEYKNCIKMLSYFLKRNPFKMAKAFIFYILTNFSSVALGEPLPLSIGLIRPKESFGPSCEDLGLSGEV